MTENKNSKSDHKNTQTSWTQFFPFESDYDELPDLKEMHLSSLGPFCAELSNELETPLALAGSMAFGAASTALSRCCEVEITETWIEPINLWLAPVMTPGNLKSPVEKRCLKPIRNWEKTSRIKIAGYDFNSQLGNFK